MTRRDVEQLRRQQAKIAARNGKGESHRRWLADRTRRTTWHIRITPAATGKRWLCNVCGQEFSAECLILAIVDNSGRLKDRFCCYGCLAEPLLAKRFRLSEPPPKLYDLLTAIEKISGRSRHTKTEVKNA